MNDPVDIYAPNLNKIFETFDNKVETPVLSNVKEDNYLCSLLQLGILVEKNLTYKVGEDWTVMQLSGNKLSKEFRRKLLDMPIVNDIIQGVGRDGKTTDEIASILVDKYPKNTVITFLSWTETTGILQLNSTKYYISNVEEDEEDFKDYPSLDDEVSIKDDKYSVFEYLRKLQAGSIILSPDFQRHEVWKIEQKSKFIESVLRGLPLPPIYLKKDSNGQYIVVDGLQRTSALRDFMDGKLCLRGLEPEENNKLNGVTIDTLDNVRQGLRARIEDRQLFVYVMEPSVPMSVVYDVFNRINTGGTQLSRQEIRNCVFQGKSTRLVKDIAESREFKDSIDYGIQELRMKDREAVLRCLSFVIFNYELDYDGSMDKFLEKTMTRINKMKDDEIESLREKTLTVFSLTNRIFEDVNFRIPTDYTRGRINIAVMESLFQCFFDKNLKNETINSTKEQFQGALKHLLENEKYLESVRWATSSTMRVKTRFRLAHNAFDKLFNI